MHTGERQAAKMRLAYLRSMLDQDIAVFDTEASTGEVINAITSDILVVQDAISEKVRSSSPCLYLAVASMPNRPFMRCERGKTPKRERAATGVC
jgi:ATP-binding cassette subfamily B (MDR/TAP) protein 1